MSKLFPPHKPLHKPSHKPFSQHTPTRRMLPFADNNQLFWGMRRGGQTKIELGFTRGDLPPAFVRMTMIEWTDWLKNNAKPPPASPAQNSKP